MNRIKIYIDEDAMDSDLVAALGSRGVPVITALDAGLTEKPDEEQLLFAMKRGCVLYTFNVRDFHRHNRVLGWRTIAPHYPPSSEGERRKHAKPSGVPRQFLKLRD